MSVHLICRRQILAQWRGIAFEVDEDDLVPDVAADRDQTVLRRIDMEIL